jgi:hypothetical protein
MSEDTVKLKLFVWPEFAPDHTDGLAVAFARNVEEAQRLIENTAGFWPTTPGPVEEYPCPPDRPIAFVVLGCS